jgi:MFS family permease
VAILAVPVFVAIERRTAAPLVVLAWFRTRNFAWPVLSQGLANFAYMGGFFLIPQVLGTRGLGFGEATVGYLVIARPLAFSLIAPVAAATTMRVGERVAGVAGALGVVVSMVLWSTVGLHASPVFIIAATAMSGVGLGIASPALTALMAGSVDAGDLGVAGAMQQLSTQLGSVLGSAVLATVSATADRHDMSTFHLAFLIGGAVAVAAAGAASRVQPQSGLRVRQ